MSLPYSCLYNDFCISEDITFEHAPSPQHPAINTDALIECRAKGQPVPTISWRYTGKTLSPARKLKY